MLSFVTVIRAGNFLSHAIANLAPERNGETALFSEERCGLDFLRGSRDDIDL